MSSSSVVILALSPSPGGLSNREGWAVRRWMFSGVGNLLKKNRVFAEMARCDWLNVLTYADVDQSEVGGSGAQARGSGAQAGFEGGSGQGFCLSAF